MVKHPFCFNRYTEGERSPNAKLTEEQVVEVLLCHRAGMKRREIAAKTGLKPSAITNITLRRLWLHVRLADRFTAEQLEAEIKQRMK